MLTKFLKVRVVEQINLSRPRVQIHIQIQTEKLTNLIHHHKLLIELNKSNQIIIITLHLELISDLLVLQVENLNLTSTKQHNEII